MAELDAPTGTASVSKPMWKEPGVLNLLLIALLAEIGYAALNLSTMPVYLKYDRKFGEAVIGLVLTTFFISEALFKSVMGHFADRFGAKRMMLAAPIISAGTSLLSLLIPHTGASPIEVMLFVLLRICDGAALAMLWPAAFAQMNAIASDAQRTQAMSLLNLCYMLGIALAFPIGGIVNDLVGAKSAGLSFAALVFIGVALAIFRLVEDKKTAHIDDEHGGGIKEFLGSVSQIPEYLLIAVITFAGIGFPAFIFKIFPGEQFNLSESAIGALIFPGAILMAVLSVPMTKFGERFGRVRSVHLGLALCAIGMWIIASGMIFSFLRLPIMFAIGGVPIGLGFLLAIPAWMASVSDINPAKRASNIGAIMTAQGIGMIIGGPIGSLCYQKLQPLGVQLRLGPDFGRYSPFLGCALCITLGWILSIKVLQAPAPASSKALPDDGVVAEAVSLDPDEPSPTTGAAVEIEKEDIEGGIEELPETSPIPIPIEVFGEASLKSSVLETPDTSNENDGHSSR